MNETVAQAQPVEFDDVQGLLKFGYKHMTQACFLLLRVKHGAAARAWLAAAPVTSAVAVKPPPQTALQVALTAEGLQALGVAPGIVAGFAPEFVAGMSGEASRAGRLGDVADSAPGRWEWGAAPRVPHVLVMLYAAPGLLAALKESVLAQCNAGF